MTTAVDELYEKARHLPLSDRAALAGLLVDTLEGAIDSEIERAWRREVAKRVAELDSGAVKTVPGHEVRVKLRDILGEP
ncbi:MAG: addiction module protein [Pyrinomonadaceae bacterium]